MELQKILRDKEIEMLRIKKGQTSCLTTGHTVLTANILLQVKSEFELICAQVAFNLQRFYV